MTISSDSMWLLVRPCRTDRLPHASLPIMPPIVQRLCDDGSGPKVSPCGATASRRSSSTTPGSTRAVRACGSTSRMRFMPRENSSTRPGPMALPAMLVPPPRAVTGTPSSRQARSAAETSSGERGKATARGATR
nr:hypothetical protein [Lentzea indica]